jgi:hypothetical protein
MKPLKLVSVVILGLSIVMTSCSSYSKMSDKQRPKFEETYVTNVRAQF